MPARRLDQPVPEHRVRQLVEISDEALNARVDQFLGNAVPVAARIDQTGDVVERPGIARADERRAHRFAATAHRQHHFDQGEQDEFLARDDDIGATRARGVAAEQVVGLVDGVRTAGDDQRAMRSVDPVGVADQLHAALGMQAHARDHEHIGDPAVELHLRGPEIAVPLLQDDPGLVEPGVRQGRADGPDARGNHSRVGEDERQHPRAMIEGAGDHRRQVVLPCAKPQALPQARQLTRSEQFVAARASGKLHGEPLQKKMS